MLLHDDKDCEIWLKSRDTLSMDQQQFGHWIRARPFSPTRRRSMEVKGFELKGTKNQASKSVLVGWAPQYRVGSSNPPLLTNGDVMGVVGVDNRKVEGLMVAKRRA